MRRKCDIDNASGELVSIKLKKLGTTVSKQRVTIRNESGDYGLATPVKLPKSILKNEPS
jgi:hypothetical protein